MNREYDHKDIEKKWQEKWEADGIYKTLSANEALDAKRDPYYVLDMFPYPSGAGLHVGHPRGYIGSDVFARMKRMQGFNVLHPMGYDAFGLPAEQYAIEHKVHPREAVEKNIKTFRSQLDKIGFSYDWSRQVNTTDPEYYKWTQWIFLQIYESWYDRAQDKARPITDLVTIFESSGNKDLTAVCDADVLIFSADDWRSYSPIEKQQILMKYRLAYEGYSEVNWCPGLGTVLANDEIVDGPNGDVVSERGGYPVEKKRMRQWFMRITAYADRLIAGLENIDWPENIKEIQKNWIGKSEGSEITFKLSSGDEISVFTTRADTLFGVTYVVLAPEHPLVETLKSSIENWDDVEKYLALVKQKSDQDRTESKEKTGIELCGVSAINPVNGAVVPVWIADYVLAGYGTGAVMAVPAHDERDFEFAQKYDLPIKNVIAQSSKNKFSGKDIIRRDGAVSIVENGKGEFLVLETQSRDGEARFLFPQGGIEDGEKSLDAAIREIREESGYHEIDLIKELGCEEVYYDVRESIRHRIQYFFGFKLRSEEKEDQKLEQYSDGSISKPFKVHWMSYEEVIKKISTSDHTIFLEKYLEKLNPCFIGDGKLVNSGNYNDLISEEARKKITEAVGGKLVTKYKMRDAIFARQRYWGEPIPLMYGSDGLITSVDEAKLPLQLPDVSSYEPIGTGESPLAGVPDWSLKGYETNTMPGWAGSSWYFLRYTDPQNKENLASGQELNYWSGGTKAGLVDMYVGGAEHATGHLLYSRFWHKFLKDYGCVPTEEPFQTLRNQGMIGGADGRKMSKRWGNVVNPDDVVKTFGADSLRVFEMFLGPFESHLPWSTDGIVGPRRFVEKVWRLQEKVSQDPTPDALLRTLHKTIQKVSSDIEGFKFNTAVSAMMIFINEFEKSPSISQADWLMFLKLLAPFAPHVTEELWQELSAEKGPTLKTQDPKVGPWGAESIHLSDWPTYDPALIIDDTVTLGVQVNGKVRAEITIAKDAPESEIKNMVLELPEIIKWIENKNVKKFIYIPGKIVSIVLG